MTFEHQALLIVVLGGIALLSAAANVVQIIATFRRRPPAEAQFADSVVNAADHDRLHRRIGDLRDHVSREFVTVGAYNAAEVNRTADRKAIFDQLKELTIAVSDVAARLDERRPK